MLSIIVAGVYIILLVFKKLSARAYRKSVSLPKKNIKLERVAILQPILSGDVTLSSTLESNLDVLPGAHFYWLVDDDDPAAHTIVDELIQSHPDKNINKLSYACAPEGINPKLYKLNQVLAKCTQEYCIVLDDDTTLPEDSLQMMLSELAHCELVTGLPQYRDTGNFYSRLLAAFVNNNASSTYLSLLPYMEPITINGMCYGFHREKFEKMGGFQPILSCLTDDLAMAELILSLGGKIRQTPFLQTIETSIESAQHYARQMHRWYVFANILFFKQKAGVQALIFILHGLPPLLLLMLWGLLILDFSLISLSAVAVVLAVRQWILLGLSKNVSKIGISILSETLQTLHLIHAFCSRKIRWRTRRYRVRSNSQFSNV